MGLDFQSAWTLQKFNYPESPSDQQKKGSIAPNLNFGESDQPLLKGQKETPRTLEKEDLPDLCNSPHV